MVVVVNLLIVLMWRRFDPGYSHLVLSFQTTI